MRIQETPAPDDPDLQNTLVQPEVTLFMALGMCA